MAVGKGKERKIHRKTQNNRQKSIQIHQKPHQVGLKHISSQVIFLKYNNKIKLGTI